MRLLNTALLRKSLRRLLLSQGSYGNEDDNSFDPHG